MGLNCSSFENLIYFADIEENREIIFSGRVVERSQEKGGNKMSRSSKKRLFCK